MSQHMKALQIEPERRTARIEPGLTWGEVSHALQPSGLALTAGDAATVGVGHQYPDRGSTVPCSMSSQFS